MTDYELNAEPGRYEVQGAPLGMNALVAARRRQLQARQQSTAAAAAAQGLTVAPVPATASGSAPLGGVATTPGTGGLGIEGQKPGVEERNVRLPELLIPALVIAGEEEAEGQLIQAVSLPWFEIIREVERDPEFLHRLDWRKLEELIAGAYKREGWPDVVLTPRSRDGGRDIIVSRPGLGAIRFYDQVKAYSAGHRVTANDVRALVGVLTLHPNVSKAVITTTAEFAPGVPDEMKALIPYRLELKDGPTLRKWLTETA